MYSYIHDIRESSRRMEIENIAGLILGAVSFRVRESGPVGGSAMIGRTEFPFIFFSLSLSVYA